MTVKSLEMTGYRPRQIEAELSRKRELAEYSESLAEWQELSAAFIKAVDLTCASVRELASAATRVEGKRQALAADHARLRAEGAHTQPPKVASKAARTVLDGASRGRKAAMVAVGVATKDRA